MSMIWVKFGEQTQQEKKCFNANVECNIFLDFIKSAISKETEEFAKRKDLELKNLQITLKNDIEKLHQKKLALESTEDEMGIEECAELMEAAKIKYSMNEKQMDE